MTRILGTPDGATLLVREWFPAERPWLRLLLMHGLAEHSGRYERTGRLLADAGIDVTAYDQRGHGGSSGVRGDIGRWSDLADDLALVLGEVRSGDGRPVAVLGHSTGGLVALDAVLSRSIAPDMLVLSAPALGDGLPRWQHVVAPILARVLPTMSLQNAWEPSVLSRDPDVARAYATDPLVLSSTTVRMGAYAITAQKRAIANMGALRVPAFVTHGAEDRLVPPASTESLGRVLGVTRKVYPGLRHETLNEPEGPQVVADMVAWLRDSVDAAD